MFKKYKMAVCADGFTASIQADAGAYCSPRNNEGPYTAVEVGYPSQVDPLLLPYAEDPDNPTNTVYGWVPTAVMLECLESHGGWVGGEIPPMEIADKEEI